MCNSANVLTLKELEDLRKLCGEQENYYHRSFLQCSFLENNKKAMLMQNKSSTAKKLRFKLTEIIDNELESIVNLAGSANKE